MAVISHLIANGGFLSGAAKVVGKVLGKEGGELAGGSKGFLEATGWGGGRGFAEAHPNFGFHGLDDLRNAGHFGSDGAAMPPTFPHPQASFGQPFSSGPGHAPFSGEHPFGSAFGHPPATARPSFAAQTGHPRASVRQEPQLIRPQTAPTAHPARQYGAQAHVDNLRGEAEGLNQQMRVIQEQQRPWAEKLVQRGRGGQYDGHPVLLTEAPKAPRGWFGSKTIGVSKQAKAEYQNNATWHQETQMYQALGKQHNDLGLRRDAKWDEMHSYQGPNGAASIQARVGHLDGQANKLGQQINVIRDQQRPWADKLIQRGRDTQHTRPSALKYDGHPVLLTEAPTAPRGWLGSKNIGVSKQAKADYQRDVAWHQETQAYQGFEKQHNTIGLKRDAMWDEMHQLRS